MKLLLAVAGSALALCAAPASKNLDVHMIDVEGGKAILVVSPSGETMLYDAGWPGARDVGRIVAAAQSAKVTQIDYLVMSHYDIDHVGSLAELSAAIPIKHVIDNGDPAPESKGAPRNYKPYAAAREKIPHTVVKPGDKIPVKGIDITVITAAGKRIDKPLKGAGAANPVCATLKEPAVLPTDNEDNMSIGLLFEYGKFRMLDLADLEQAYDYRLMCPNNPVGQVDVWNVSVHGQAKGPSPALAGALHARVDLLENGPRKGGDAATWPVLRNAPGLEDIWQVHYSFNGTKETNPPENFNVNLVEKCEAKELTISAHKDGGFTVTNTRNGFSKTYKPRK
jgi:competence protein ComEC